MCLPNFTTEAITKLMSKPFTKYDFITDLDYGKASEKTIAGILGLSAKEFEVKTERDWWTRTGNIAILKSLIERLRVPENIFSFLSF